MAGGNLQAKGFRFSPRLHVDFTAIAAAPELAALRLKRVRHFLIGGKHMRFSRREFLGAAAATALPAQEKRGLKIFMHCDMEGSSGIFTREQAWYWENGAREQVAAQARELFTADVNSASAAALAAGVTELIVCDTHHGGGNLLQDKVLRDRRITYLYRSVGMEDGKRRWMPGMDRDSERADAAGTPRQGGHGEVVSAARLEPRLAGLHHQWPERRRNRNRDLLRRTLGRAADFRARR